MKHSLIVYIDEGGDSGVRDGIRYSGSRYEWFSLGALAIRASNELLPVDWVRQINAECGSTQKPDLHYANLSMPKRLRCCEIIADKPVRAFALLSHKTNMREYQNVRMGGGVPEANFYNWCIRLLIERVMYWADRWFKSEGVAPHPIRFVFSEKGGHNYEHLFSYLAGTLSMQARAGSFVKKPKRWIPEMVSREMLSVKRHKSLAGLQLADCIASCFYQAANTASPKWDTSPAKAIFDQVAADELGIRADVGLTVWPLAHQASVPVESRAIFEHYGYKF